MPEITIRRATIEDTTAIVRHRNLMFGDMGLGTPESRAISDGHFDKWLRPRLISEEYIGWVACDGDEIVAGLGLWVMDWLPAPDGITFVRPYVCNVYTENSHRKQGIAHRLVDVMLAYCKECGYKRVRLHASVFGKPIYEQIGFIPTNEMEFVFE
ncbi:MAG: GNAT family N-acetyltransferase [Anaerolineae bacterium]|jgi:GNAT superfamily N-acetyltransferase|nr:GNAT family N-acetyltransferase [Anaerolineae bacterium]